MPYRLRRVIGINIRNPRDEGPSLRIAELDTRGAVIAAGRNGVGKTSFLRLIPLFYGATPTRILRGSGLTTMIRYMLPHPSSAVAYEYERTSAEDLRCVVMHCRPDEDAPQFHLLRGAFEESYFYDENGTFVTREEFKARVEKMGTPVEQKLFLSEYRSVILNERATSKNAAVLRNLAAAHSLGPTGTTLQGLDHIAAAMGNEKIMFRDLQDIVVERITSSISDETVCHTTREIKKGAKDVSSWLTDLQHLRDLKGKQSQADELAKGCGSVQKTAQYLGGLRSAVKALAADISSEQQRLRHEKAVIEVAAADKAQELQDQIQQATVRRDAAKAKHDEAAQTVRSTEDRAGHFEKIGIKSLVAESDQETQLLAEQRQVLANLERLRSAAAGIEESYATAIQQLTKSVASEVSRISDERTAVHDEERASLDSVDAAESEALAELSPSARLSELPDEISAAQINLGELQGESKNPQAPAKLLKDLESCTQSVAKARDVEREARKLADAASEKERAASSERRRAIDSHAVAHLAVERMRQRLADAEADAKPAAGSLQEFLRASRLEGICEVAKVLDPLLVKSTGLSPTPVPDANYLGDGLVAVGPVVLDVHRVPMPEWFDLKQAQERVAGARSQVDTAEGELKKAEQELRAANGAHKEAEGEAAKTANDWAYRRADVDSLEQRERELKKERDDKVAAERERLAAAVNQSKERIAQLQLEKNRLEAEYREAEQRVRDAFIQQRGSVRLRKNDALRRLKDAEELMRERERAEVGRLEQSRHQGLRAAGVDPTKMTELEVELAALQGRLQQVAEHRHEVTGWKVFQSGDLARLEFDRETANQAREALGLARSALSEAESALEAHVSESRLAIQRLDIDLRNREQDGLTLQELLDSQLAVIADAPSGHIVRPWAVEEISAEVRRRRAELTQAASQVENLYQALRSLMRRYDGQVNDWLTQAEAALPSFERWPDHEVKRWKGLMICQWFERDYIPAVNSVHQDLTGILSLAASFVRDMDLFERQVSSFNHGLQKALKSVTGFDNFRDLQVEVRSSVHKLEYINTLQQMQQMSDSKVSLMRGTSAHMARDIELPSTDVDPVIRSFRDFLQSEGGISVNLADQIRLECSLTINKSRVVISTEEEFKARASNGNSALIVAMFLMGFAQMVRKDSPVRITWVTDEIGRFDSGNVAAFLETLDNNRIDVISAGPQADPSMLYLFDRHCIFRKDGAIWEEREAQEMLHAH